MSDPPPMALRRVDPGRRWRFSELTVLIDPPQNSPPSADARTVTLLQRARSAGVASFDIAGARFPQRAERLISRAFPSSDEAACVIVGRSLESLAREHSAAGEVRRPTDLESAVQESLDESRRRLGAIPIAVVEWEPEDNDPDAKQPPELPTLTGKDDPDAPIVARRLTAPVTSLPVPEAGPALFAAPFSLLETELIASFESGPDRTVPSLIARDPFAQGRLDGTRFEDQAMLHGPSAGPVDLRRLHEEFDPIVRLGFLTEGHSRTLGQAALQFVLRWPWVLTAVVPLPSPERFEELFDYRLRPPLSDDNLRRVATMK